MLDYLCLSLILFVYFDVSEAQLLCFLFCMAGLHKLNMLNLEGCNITAACLESISGLLSLCCSCFLMILLIAVIVIFKTPTA